ncbi:MAG TPA: hypothetical protein VKA37_08225 [Halobacteriales archaeon]|nr:hypothetical protein [Halobacteriales archaeon]
MVSEHNHPVEACGLDCAVCGNEEVVVCAEGTVECPNCSESYSLVVHEGFTLLEWDGWITRVTFDLLDELPGAVPG